MNTYEFHFDFGSPNAYLSHCVIPEIAARTGVKIDYIPVLLGGVFKATNNVSPMVSMQGIKNKAEYSSLETARFVKKHSISQFQMNPFFPVNTLQVMRAAVAAQLEGVSEAYINAIYHSMWVEPKKMDEADIILSVLKDAGLDGEKLMEKSKDAEVKAKLIENTTASVERGNFGSPTFFVGDEMFFGKNSLVDFEEFILENRA
ncbi:MAG: 2-hydroxychromene-2-carboxylate isomerase [Oceanicoccus sp.]